MLAVCADVIDENTMTRRSSSPATRRRTRSGRHKPLDKHPRLFRVGDPLLGVGDRAESFDHQWSTGEAAGSKLIDHGFEFDKAVAGRHVYVFRWLEVLDAHPGDDTADGFGIVDGIEIAAG